MNLDAALSVHSKWKERFRTAILNKVSMDVDCISKNDCCDFGKWLQDEGKMLLGGLQSYNDCVSAHACFHVFAGRVVLAINEKKYAAAEKMIANGTSFAFASAALTSAIYHLEFEAHSKSTRDVIQKIFHSDFIGGALVSCC